MTETTANPAPRGGLNRMSNRVMNLAHMLTQNARRHGGRAGLVWGERSWTWREIDAKVPVIMMTGRSSAEDVAAGLVAGADGYVSKPFQMSGLVKAVQQVLGLK